jgi:hypothetical protein
MDRKQPLVGDPQTAVDDPRRQRSWTDPDTLPPARKGQTQVPTQPFAAVPAT